MATFHSGKLGKCTINGTEVSIKSWNFRGEVPMAKFVNSTSGGFVLSEDAAGKAGAFSIVVSRDFDSNVFDAPVGLVIGAHLTNVKLYEHDTSGPFYDIPSSYVQNTNENVVISGTDEVGFGADCVTDGTFKYPGNITP